METQRIGAYEVLFELGRGGMGTIFLARAVGEAAGVEGFERLVAIKRVHAHLLANPDTVKRFLQEAKVAAHIHHANVVGIHQVGSDEAGHFLVQDYVEGTTLEGLIDHAMLRRELLPPPVVLRIALDALAALHAVHEATDTSGQPLGILHRDVSTQNLLVGRDGVTRLSDFGIAKYAQSSVVTDGRYLEGRVLYMPPEYLRREPTDRRVDVYGLGITLWIALAGDPPWPGAGDGQIVQAAITEGVPPLSTAGLSIAPAIEAIVARACSRDVDARFASARAMLEAIEEVGRHTGWVASHAEVEAQVDRLAGKELAARRAAVAKARPSPPDAAPAATTPAAATSVTTTPVAATPAAATPATTTPTAVEMGAPRRRSVGVIAVVGIALVGIAAAGLVLGRDKPAVEASPALPSASAPLATTTAAPAAEPPPKEPTAKPAEPEPSVKPLKPSYEGAASGPKPRAPVEPSPKPKPSQDPPGLLGPPATISTSNPYRAGDKPR